MKKYITFLLILLSPLFPCSAKNILKPDSLNLLKQKVADLNDQIIRTKGDIEYTKSLVQIGNGTISNQLSSSQHTLSTLSTLFTIIGIALAIIIPLGGWYITRLANRVTNNLTEANRILVTITSLKAEVSIIQTEIHNTRDLIQNNLSALYQSLQDEEMKSIFNRLEIEPMDIQHLFSKLTTVNLTHTYFVNLKEIYFKVKEVDNKAASAAIGLLAQHFPLQSLNDQEILSELKKYYLSDALYITEYPKYYKALCDFTKDKDINDNIALFENALLGMELKATNLEMYAEKMLKIWDGNLASQQKTVIINLIDTTPKFEPLKSKIKNWNNWLTND